MKSRATMTSEIGLSLAVLLILALLINPYWMPMGLVMVFLVVLALLVFGLGVFIWRESPKDEREFSLMAQAGRHAYLAGAVVLTIGVAVQTLQHDVDDWLVLTLGVMVLVKVFTSSRR